MAFLSGWMRNEKTPRELFVVVHPLDDRPEERADTASLGPMPMTRAVRHSLIALRAYLIVMMLLVLYQVLNLAGLVGRHGPTSP